MTEERDVWDIPDAAEAEADEIKSEQDENTALWPLDKLTDTDKPENLQQLCQLWIWVTGMERFLNRLHPGKYQWKAKQFDTNFNYLTPKHPSVAGILFKQKHLLRRYRSPIFTPGDGETDGKLYNIYRPSLIVPKKGDTSLWDGHIEWLFDEETRNRVITWLAWVLQNPNRRPSVALLLLGRITGTGKSFIARVMEQIIGPENTQRPKNSSLRGDFNPWLSLCQLAIIEELSQINRREVVGALRDMITEQTLEVNPKGINPYKIHSHVCMLGISNEPDALPIPPGDRRWEVAETLVTQEQKDQAEADGWFGRIMPLIDEDAPGGIDKDFVAAIAYKLMYETDASSFKPGSATESAAKINMIELGEDELVTWLNENRNNDPLTRQFVNIQDDVVEIIPPSVKAYKPNATVRKYLKDRLSGIPLGRNFKFDDTVQKLWAINDAGVEAKAELAKHRMRADELLMKRDITGEVKAARALRRKKFRVNDWTQDNE